MSNKYPLQKFATERANYYKLLSKEQKAVHDEIQTLVNNAIKTFEDKKSSTTQEINEYDRQRIGFFAIAISFIIGGLLSSQIGVGDSSSAKSFYLASIVFASFTALCLFIEYTIISRFMSKWQFASQEIVDHIKNADWKSPKLLDEWIQERQAKLPIGSNKTVHWLEVISLIFALTALVCWLIERLFDPYWFIFKF